MPSSNSSLKSLCVLLSKKLFPIHSKIVHLESINYPSHRSMFNLKYKTFKAVHLINNIILLALLTGHSYAFLAPLAQATNPNYNLLYKSSGMEDDADSFAANLSESDQGLVVIVGSLGSCITLFSEYTLKTTGCGLPAGPAGLIGLVEGLSYLSVSTIGIWSLYSFVKSGRLGLPPGPSGLFGAAVGLSWFSIAVGLIVLAFQIIDYQYIPNAIPMEGGMCK